MRVVKGDFTAEGAIAEIGDVDAVILFDVLLHTVDPDWDEMLERFAPLGRCFVIANPQWQFGPRSVRLIELGRERFLQAVPSTRNHDEIFDHLDEIHPLFNRPYRDSMHIWQWGVTDEDLIGKMESLGFQMAYYARHRPFWGADGFVNTAFVFTRT